MPHSRLQHTEKDKTDAQAMCTPYDPTHIDAPRSIPSTFKSFIPFKLWTAGMSDSAEPTDMQEAYRLTNALNCSLRSFGFGAHSLFDEPDDGGETRWAPKERHHSSTADDGTKPYPLPPSSTQTTSSSPFPLLNNSGQSRNTTRAQRRPAPSHLEHCQRLKILDALAILLDTDDSRVAVTAFGPGLREEALQDGTIIDRLVVDVVVCGSSNHTTNAAEKTVRITKITSPLQLILERSARVPLFEHAQVLNHFFSALSSCSHPSREFRLALSQLVKYTTASHAEKVVQRIRDNSLSGVLHRIFCSLVMQNAAVKTDNPQQPKSLPPPTHHPSSGPPAPPMTRVGRAQVDRDHLFLGRLVHRSGDIQAILKGKVPVPNLTALAVSVLNGREGAVVVQPVNMYTDKTKAEFHQLLSWLLGSTEDGYLGALAAFVHLVREGYDDCVATGSASVEESGDAKARRKWEKKVQKALDKLTLLGVLLRDALATSAFEAHLKAIAPLLLQVHRRRRQGCSSPESDPSLRGSPWSVDGMLGSALPQFSLEDLGKNQENMDFNHATGLAHVKPWDEEEVVAEVYRRWMKGLVEHLEVVVVLQKWAINGGRGCRVTVGSVVGLPRKDFVADSRPEGVSSGMVKGDESPSSDSDGGTAGGHMKKRQKVTHVENSDANANLQASNVVLELNPSWRGILRDAYTDVPEYSEVAPDIGKVIEFMEELIHRDTLPKDLRVPESSAAHPPTQWCPEACLATLLCGSYGCDSSSTTSTSMKRKSRKGDGRSIKHRGNGEASAESEVPLQVPMACLSSIDAAPQISQVKPATVVFEKTRPCLIGVSRGCCPSCSAVLTALASEPSLVEHCDFGAVSQQFLTSSCINATRGMDAIPGETASESLWAGSHCCLPLWLSEDMAKKAVLEARRSLVRLVNGELEEQFDHFDSSEGEEDENEG